MAATVPDIRVPPRAQPPKAVNWSLKQIEWGAMTPFILVHLACFAVFFTGFTWPAVIFGAAFWAVRMFAITGWLHRYFSHRTFKTSRWFQFFWAVVAQMASQRGALWWAAHHRHHHKSSDQEDDLHSPRQSGFWYSHVLWIYDKNSDTDWARIKDFQKFPELVWLNDHWWVVPWTSGFLIWLFLGWPGLVIGFFLSTTLLWHSTFTINSLTHVIGKRRFETNEDSRNHWALALLTFGEGWHNNHHHYEYSTRQGFAWYEVDLTYYILKLFERVGLVWDIREPPERVMKAVRG